MRRLSKELTVEDAIKILEIIDNPIAWAVEQRDRYWKDKLSRLETIIVEELEKTFIELDEYGGSFTGIPKTIIDGIVAKIMKRLMEEGIIEKKENKNGEVHTL
jgi:hypothetical protein